MAAIDTVVLGAGHAGLAVSRLLTDAGRDHVVLERGRPAESWRSQRWESLHLLTPNWMLRLPGWSYAGGNRDGFMSAARLVRHLERYAASFGAPVVGGTTVERVTAPSGLDGRRRYLVDTDQGSWHAHNVVVATGAWARPNRPSGLEDSDASVISSNEYRSPSALPPGGVLVVGASASGVQIADELNRSGRSVLLSVGRHTRMPRRYRGMDIFWWLERTGRLARTIDQVRDPVEARNVPSMQLTGQRGQAGLEAGVDLAALQERGVRVVGRLDRLAGRHASFRDDLATNIGMADVRLRRFLDAVDTLIEDSGLAAQVPHPVRPRPVPLPAPVRSLDLRAAGISTVVLATGFRPDFSWLELPVVSPDGSIQQLRGVTDAPGLYVVGQRFQHRRDSGFIDGARYDARTVVAHLIQRSGSSAGAPVAEKGA